MDAEQELSLHSDDGLDGLLVVGDHAIGEVAHVRVSLTCRHRGHVERAAQARVAKALDSQYFLLSIFLDREVWPGKRRPIHD